MSVTEQIPTTVFTGFLGSGKTTIISHLIEHLQNQSLEVIYIKNEIGETDLDAKLMRGDNIVSREILNGCICCTLVGPFVSAIEEVVNTYQPDRIIIESAGTADPASLALMVSDHPLLERDGVISIIDVLNFSGYQDLSPAAKRQAKMTDLIVLNKVEQVDLAKKRRVVGYVRELNEWSPIVEAPKGVLNPDLAFGISSGEISALLSEDQNHKNDQHIEEDQIEGVTFTSAKRFNKEVFTSVIEQLPKFVFRLKGVVYFAGGPEVVNAIFKRVNYSQLPANYQSQQTELICIGFRISERQEQVFKLLRQAAVE